MLDEMVRQFPARDPYPELAMTAGAEGSDPLTDHHQESQESSMKSRIAAVIARLTPRCIECHTHTNLVQYLGGESCAYVCNRCAFDYGYHLYMSVGV